MIRNRRLLYLGLALSFLIGNGLVLVVHISTHHESASDLFYTQGFVPGQKIVAPESEQRVRNGTEDAKLGTNLGIDSPDQNRDGRNDTNDASDDSSDEIRLNSNGYVEENVEDSEPVDVRSICRWARENSTWESHAEPWVTFLVPHLIRPDSPRNLDHLYDFYDDKFDGRVQVFVTIINATSEFNQTICIGQREEECVPRRVLSEEEFELMMNETDYNYEWKRKTFQQMSDIAISISLYQELCEPHFPKSIFWSMLDDDNRPCPGLEFHLAQLAHYGTVSDLARTGEPYMIRIAPGSSGLLIPSQHTNLIGHMLEWSLAGGANWTRWATDDMMDYWAIGEYTVPGDAPSQGFHMYYMVVLEHMGEQESNFLSKGQLKKRTVHKCGAKMLWPYMKRDEECRFGALDPCPEGSDWPISIPGVRRTVPPRKPKNSTVASDSTVTKKGSSDPTSAAAKEAAELLGEPGATLGKTQSETEASVNGLPLKAPSFDGGDDDDVDDDEEEGSVKDEKMDKWPALREAVREMEERKQSDVVVESAISSQQGKQEVEDDNGESVHASGMHDKPIPVKKISIPRGTRGQ